MQVVTSLRGRRSLALVALVLLLTAAMLATATSAFALTGSVTVKPQVGGVPTRFTFEGTASTSDQAISEVTFVFPEGFDLTETAKKEQANGTGAEAITLEGLTRVPTSATKTIEGQTVRVTFEPPVSPTYKDDEGKQQPTTLRITINEVLTPNQGKTYELPATYISDGQQNALLTAAGSPLTFSYTSPSQADIISRALDDQPWVQAINNVKLLSLFFKPQLVALSVPLLFYGWLYSIALVLIAFPAAIVIGLLLAFAKMSKIAPLRWIASAYVNVVRGTPLFLQIAVVFIGLRVAGLRVPDFLSAIFVLALNSSAYLTEIFRAGIQSIAKGQFEAASSLGMNYAQSMRYVIIPQTVKRVLPTMTSEFILLFKDTALFSAFGIIELMYRANSIVSRTGNLTPFVIAAVYYLIVTVPLINYVGRLERRLAVSEGGHVVAAPRPKRGALQEAAPSGVTRTVDSDEAGTDADILGGSQEGE
jgi:polar amino acid transport system substrate-binding protein